MANEAPRRIWLVSSPRTASNLLLRILNLDEQPNVHSCEGEDHGYFFTLARRLFTDLQLSIKPPAEWSKEEKDQLMGSYQRCYDNLLKYLSAGAAKSKITFFKEHILFALDPTAQPHNVFSKDGVQERPWKAVTPGKENLENAQSMLNPTVFPDEFLTCLSPVFLIRHPGLAFPSFYRAYRDIHGAGPAKLKQMEMEFKAVMTFKWTRGLYEWYTLHKQDLDYSVDAGANEPVVLDADDFTSGSGALSRVCDILGLDASKLRFTWEPATADELPEKHIKRRMENTLLSSKGVMRSSSSRDLNIDEEIIKWKDEFGEECGELVAKFVREAMDDYEFLKAKAIGN